MVSTLSLEVGKYFHRIADLADKDEGSPDLFGGKGATILFGLFTRVAHLDVPATMRAASSARGCCRKAGQRFLTGGQCDLFCTAFLPALFGLQYEAPAFVEVDLSVPRLSCLVTEIHGTLQPVRLFPVLC